MAQARILWPAPARPRGRICSAAGRTLSMSSEIRDIVDRVYRTLGLPPEWSPEQQRMFLDHETTRLSRRAAELAAELGETAVAEWTQRMGRQPDYLTTAGLLNNATLRAREVVLADELYAQLPEPQDPAATESDPASPSDSSLGELRAEEVDWGNPDRWRTLRRSEPSEAVSALVARVWPTRSDWFTIKAEYLLQARSEDGLELPNSPDSELAHELARLVEDDLRSDGLPLE
jgi:hypothetical protein